MGLETRLLTGGLAGEPEWCPWNCENPAVANGQCRITCSDATQAAAARNKPFCMVNDGYCTRMISQFLTDYQFVRSSTQDRECIVKNSKNEQFRLKVAQDCTSTISPLNASCIVNQDLCQTMVSTQQVLSEYQYSNFSTAGNLCILKHKTNQQPYKIVVAQDCTSATLSPL